MKMRIVYTIFILTWIVLLTRVYYISIKSNKYYERLAEQNSIKIDKIPPIRGQIFDINGNPLAVNRLGFSILIKPHLKSDSKELNDEINVLSQTFSDLNASKLKKEYIKNNSPYSQEFVEVIRFLEYDDLLPYFAILNFRPNLEIKPISMRHYPYDHLASHIIGYVGRANEEDIKINEVAKITNYVGRNGVEKYYNDILQGEAGEKKTQVTALNKKIKDYSYKSFKSDDITLTIDLELQKYISEIFAEHSGAAVVMSLKDGGILAAGSYPEYNLNPFVSGISKKTWDIIIKDLNHPFTNKLVNSLYPPGSVVKMTMGMAFFNSGKISPMTRIMCDPYFELGDRKFRNWKNWGYSEMTIVDALRESCDTYFYRGSYKVGIEHISPTLLKYGFGKKTGIDLPNEYLGIAPSKEWKKQRTNQPWYQGDTMNTSIGQGDFLVTPIQVAKNTAFFAKGVELIPHFLYKINDKLVDWEVKDTLTNQEKNNLQHVRQGMYEVANVIGGTGFRVLSEAGIRVGAKTGTAQVVGISQTEKQRMKEEDMDYYSRSHAWITTYGPFEDPQYVVTVLVEHGSHGGGTSGPLAAKIYNKLIEMGYIDKKYLKPSKREAFNKTR